MLCIPQSVAHQLELEELDKRPVTISDGSSQQAPYVGPVRVDFEASHCRQLHWDYAGKIQLGVGKSVHGLCLRPHWIGPRGGK